MRARKKQRSDQLNAKRGVTDEMKTQLQLPQQQIAQRVEEIERLGSALQQLTAQYATVQNRK